MEDNEKQNVSGQPDIDAGDATGPDTEKGIGQKSSDGSERPENEKHGEASPKQGEHAAEMNPEESEKKPEQDEDGQENTSGESGTVSAGEAGEDLPEKSSENPPDAADGEKEETVSVRKEIFSWIKMIVIVLAIVVVLTQFVIINARIPSSSMERTIMTKDRLIGFRFSYWLDNPQRGDIILFKYPVNENQTFIKRVIGLPGETVRISNGKIYIDDATEPLDENYLPEEWVWENDGYEFHVPEGSYLVLGDNRNYSDDARFWAENAIEAGKASTMEEAQKYTYVKKSAIKGKAIFIYYKGFKLLTHTADYQD